jgi:hypothetical protein
MVIKMMSGTFQSAFQANTQESHHNFHRTRHSFKATNILLLLVSMLLLSGCFHDDDDDGGGTSTYNADPTGYYSSGSATVNDDVMGSIQIDDLQAMIYNDRIMIISVGQQLLYDGTINSINGNSFTASVSVYQSGQLLYSADIIDGLVENSGGFQITGTLSGDAGNSLANGNVTLHFANNETASLSQIENDSNGNTWSSNDLIDIRVTATGSIESVELSGVNQFAGCGISDGVISPISGTSLFDVTLTIVDSTIGGTCDSAALGEHTGFASAKPDNTSYILVMMISNGDVAGQGEYLPD